MGGRKALSGGTERTVDDGKGEIAWGEREVQVRCSQIEHWLDMIGVCTGFVLETLVYCVVFYEEQFVPVTLLFI